MLTGIITTLRAINGSEISPGLPALFDLFSVQTVSMSMQVCSNLASMLLEGKLLEGKLLVGKLLVGIGWSGSLLSMNSTVFKIAEFINLLYAALQLTIKVGWNRTMQQYQGLNNHTV